LEVDGRYSATNGQNTVRKENRLVKSVSLLIRSLLRFVRGSLVAAQKMTENSRCSRKIVDVTFATSALPTGLLGINQVLKFHSRHEILNTQINIFYFI